MPGYSQALEKQIDIASMWVDPFWEELSSDLANQISYLNSERVRPNPNEISEEIASWIIESDTFWVDREISRSVMCAADSLPPDTALTRHLLPCKFGFLWIDDPFLFRMNRLKSTGDISVYLDAVSRMDIGAKSCFMILYGHTDAGPLANRTGPVLIHTWPFGTSWTEPNHIDVAGDFHGDRFFVPIRGSTAEQISRFILSIFLFMQQKVVVTSPQRADRPTRRRLEKMLHAGVENKSIRIVTLRKKVYSRGDGTHDIEWSCRWIVDGHWRTYTGAGGREPKTIFISPYMKGPEGKPLKNVEKILYKVVR